MYCIDSSKFFYEIIIKDAKDLQIIIMFQKFRKNGKRIHENIYRIFKINKLKL